VVTVFGLSGGFFIWLAWHEPTHGHEMGYVLGCVMLWMALWAAMRPEYAVVVNDSGFEYADERYGFLLYFTRRQAMWSDVTRVDTRMIRGRYGRLAAHADLGPRRGVGLGNAAVLDPQPLHGIPAIHRLARGAHRGAAGRDDRLRARYAACDVRRPTTPAASAPRSQLR
jgi:hypothetical protein